MFSTLSNLSPFATNVVGVSHVDCRPSFLVHRPLFPPRQSTRPTTTAETPRQNCPLQPQPQPSGVPPKLFSSSRSDGGVGVFVTRGERTSLRGLGYSDKYIDDMQVRVAKAMCNAQKKRPFPLPKSLPETWLKATSAASVIFPATEGNRPCSPALPSVVPRSEYSPLLFIF